MCVSNHEEFLHHQETRGTYLDRVVWENEVKAHVEANIGVEKVGIRQHSGKVKSGLGASSF